MSSATMCGRGSVCVFHCVPNNLDKQCEYFGTLAAPHTRLRQLKQTISCVNTWQLGNCHAVVQSCMQHAASCRWLNNSLSDNKLTQLAAHSRSPFVQLASLFMLCHSRSSSSSCSTIVVVGSRVCALQVSIVVRESDCCLGNSFSCS